MLPGTATISYLMWHSKSLKNKDADGLLDEGVDYSFTLIQKSLVWAAAISFFSAGKKARFNATPANSFAQRLSVLTAMATIDTSDFEITTYFAFANAVTLLSVLFSRVLEFMVLKRFEERNPAVVSDIEKAFAEEMAEVLNFALGFLVGCSWSKALQILVYTKLEGTDNRLRVYGGYTLGVLLLHAVLKAWMTMYFPKALEEKLVEFDDDPDPSPQSATPAAGGLKKEKSTLKKQKSQRRGSAHVEMGAAYGGGDQLEQVEFGAAQRERLSRKESLGKVVMDASTSDTLAMRNTVKTTVL